MKEPYNYTLSEISSILSINAGNYDAKHMVVSLVAFVQRWQDEQRKYIVKKDAEKVRNKVSEVPFRKKKSLERDLFNSCILVEDDLQFPAIDNLIGR